MRAERVQRWVERWNNRVNGGWVIVLAHPIFGMGRWIVQIETTAPDKQRYTIATGFSLRDELRNAERWIEEHADSTGLVQVEHIGGDAR